METDLFVPSDMAALLAVKAAMANRKLSPAEVRTLFESHGLIRQAASDAAANENLPGASRGSREAA